MTMQHSGCVRQARGWVKHFATAALFCAASQWASVAQAEGNETLGSAALALASGSAVVSAGVGLDAGPGNINLTIPAGATVQQVIAYWYGRGAPDNTIVLDGTPAPGAQIGVVENDRRSFRADVTALNLLAAGPNSVAVSGLNFGDVAHGASLVAIVDFGSQGTAFGGRASGLSIKSIGNIQFEAALGDSGELPTTGGNQSASQAMASIAPFVPMVTLAEGEVTGSGNQTEAKAKVVDAFLLVESLGIKAELFSSQAKAECVNGAPVLSADSQAVGLEVDGVDLPITSAVDEMFVFPLWIQGFSVGQVAQVVIWLDEQIIEGNRITVHAAHIQFIAINANLTVDVFLGSSSAAIDCAPAPVADIQARDGADLAFINRPAGPAQVTNLQTFNFAPAPINRIADLHLLIGDAVAERPDVYEIKVGANTTRVVDQLASSDGAQWDHLVVPVTIPAGESALSVQLFSQKDASSPLNTRPDSLLWTAAILSVPQ